MASLNKVMLIGNLTRDPEVRYLASGDAVADCRFAVSERFRNRNGENQERTTFVDVVVWGRQAETVGKYLSKGSPAFVEGRLQLDEWESPQGEKRSKLRVRADRVQFLGSPRRAEYGDAPSRPDRGGEGGGYSRGRSADRPAAPPAGEHDDEPGDHESVDHEPDADSDNLPF